MCILGSLEAGDPTLDVPMAPKSGKSSTEYRDGIRVLSTLLHDKGRQWKLEGCKTYTRKVKMGRHAIGVFTCPKHAMHSPTSLHLVVDLSPPKILLRLSIKLTWSIVTRKKHFGAGKRHWCALHYTGCWALWLHVVTDTKCRVWTILCKGQWRHLGSNASSKRPRTEPTRVQEDMTSTKETIRKYFVRDPKSMVENCAVLEHLE